MLGSVVHYPVGASPSVPTGFFAPTGPGYPSGYPGQDMMRSMETEEHLHVIGMVSEADWEAGRGSFYYIEDKNGEKCIPVFTSPERADRFAQANFDNPEAHMQMLESIGVVHAPALTSG